MERVKWVMGEGCNVKLSWKDIRGVRYQGVTPPQIKLNIKLTHLDLRSSGTEWVSKTPVYGEGRVGRGRGLQNTFELERHKGGPAYGDNPPKSKYGRQTGTFGPP